MEGIQFRGLLTQKMGKLGSLLGDVEQLGAWQQQEAEGQMCQEENGYQKPEASCQVGLDHSRRGYPMRPKSTTKTEEGGKDRETPWLLLSFHFSISNQCSHE